MLSYQIALLLTFVTAALSSSKCTVADEARVVQCSAPLMDHYIPSHMVVLSLSGLDQFCHKLDMFRQCTSGLSGKCISRMLSNSLRLWNYLCEPNFRANATEHAECFEAIDSDARLQECVTGVKIIAQAPTEGSTIPHMDTCERSRRQLQCFMEFKRFEECRDAVEIQYSLMDVFMQNFTLSQKCELDPFADMIAHYHTIKKEQALGGCDSSGHCKCIDGYRIENDTRKCIDANECEDGTHTCSHQCVNTEGSYRCECYKPAYELSEDNRTCVHTDTEPVWLYFAHGQNIWNISDDGKVFALEIDGLEKTAMLDVDVQDSRIYYADIGHNAIEWSEIGSNMSEAIQTFEVDGTEGIAVDWVGRNLYSARKTDIIVRTLDGKYRKVLYRKELATPRALVAHATVGWLFGSDWGSSPFIYKAAADGSLFKKIVQNSIVWPNALAVDQYANRLYWADAFLDSIQSCDLDGHNRHTILSEPGVVPHVFSMVVVDDSLYWTDWTHRAILRGSKHSGLNATVIAQTALLPYGLKAYHSSVQPKPEVDYCNATDCSQLCLVSRDGKGATCACADGYELQADGKSCLSICKENEMLCGGSKPL
ncbi:Protein F14B4.1 [Aphelenchoides avenae]|nr:Protein F14B4.1 [Aphelenchus avenae]